MTFNAKNKLPAAIAAGAFFMGAAPAVARTVAHAHRTPGLTQEVQNDINQLARRAYISKPLGGAALSTTKEGQTDVVTLAESAPTSTGSDKGGVYDIAFISGVTRRGNPDFKHVFKLEVSEDTTHRNGQLTDGTLLEAEVVAGNARIAEVNAPFNVPHTITSEAAVHPLQAEARLRADWLVRWDKLANSLIGGAEHRTPTGPHLPQIWHEPRGKQALPF